MSGQAVLRGVVAAALLFGHVSIVAADTLVVPTQYPTIQAAVNAASDGDVVLIEDGVYSGVGNTSITLRGKAITVESRNGPQFCIIDGEGVNRGFLAVNGESSDTVLRGLTIRNCYGNGAALRIHQSSLTVLDCRLVSNLAAVIPLSNTLDFGPCFNITAGSADFSDCEFTDNRGSPIMSIGYIEDDGAANFTDCTFRGNAAPAGGGVFVGLGMAWFERCVFEGNDLSSTLYDGVSTCLMTTGVSSVSLVDCEFVDNWTLIWSRAIIVTGELSMYNCIFRGNFSLEGAGANVYVHGGSDARIVNCTFTDYAPTSLGYAVEAYEGEVSNCIMWNENGGGAGVAGDGVEVRFSIVQGGWPGPGNQDADPRFVDAPDDLRVREGSPAIDIGVASLFPTWLHTDFAGNPRVQGAQIDIGAYESPFERFFATEFEGIAAGDQFGYTVTRIFDWDNDWFPDFAVASPFDNSAGAGAVEIYSGRTRDLLHRFEGFAPGVGFGFDVAALDDLDGDGAGEIAISAPRTNFPASNAGAVYIFSSATGNLLRSVHGERKGDHFGYSIDSIMNPASGYRRTNLVIGAPFNDDTGRNGGKTYLYLAEPGMVLATASGTQAGERFGWSVAGLDFVNGDIWPDYIAGAPHNDDRGEAAGKAYVINGLTGQKIRSRTGKRPGDQFGRHVASAGRIDDDNHGDYIVAAPFYDTVRRSNVGRIYVYSGKGGSTLYTIFGAEANEWFGFNIEPAGDIDGDGFTDLLVGAPVRPQNNGIGAVDVISGHSGTILDSFASTVTGDQFGFSVAMLGELAFGGELTLAVGAPLRNANGAESGIVELVEFRPP